MNCGFIKSTNPTPSEITAFARRFVGVTRDVMSVATLNYVFITNCYSFAETFKPR